MKNIAVKCKGIKKVYGENETRVDALRGIDLDINDSELTLLVGPSGSGKTTLLSIITTILTPDEGQLFLLGREVTSMTENDKALFRQKNLGIVFQSLFLIPTLTVVENVTIPLLIEGISQEEAEQKAMGILKQMNIGHKAHTSPNNLSKGQQQRVAIARAMINNSKIIVCDEPTSALDHVAGGEVMHLLHDLALQSSRAVIVVTHDHRIFPHAQRIVYMNDGLITQGEEL